MAHGQTGAEGPQAPNVGTTVNDHRFYHPCWDAVLMRAEGFLSPKKTGRHTYSKT